MVKPSSILLGTLCALAGFQSVALQEIDPNEVALIVGGFYDIDATYLQSVELFGCHGTESIPLTDYPTGTLMIPGMRYLEEEGLVLACGGLDCSQSPCTPKQDCIYWSPTDGSWDDAAPDMTQGRADIFMGLMPNVMEGDEQYVPGVMGHSTDSTEILYNGEWQAYLPLDGTRWDSTECVVQKDSRIYHISDHVQVLDVEDWTFQTLATPPDNLLYPQQCAYVEIHGEPGIFTRFGYFFNLDTEAWEKKMYPPYEMLASLPNSMWTFRGRPTVFGTTDCDDVGFCLHDKIVQYQQETDEWVEIGRLAQSREFHGVVNVPGSYCESLYGESNRRTAALVIGGLVESQGGAPEPLNSVELFGCDGSSSDSIRVKDYPSGIYLHAGTYVEGLGKVMVCGGIACDGDTGQCSPSSACYYWNPETGGTFDAAPALPRERWNFIMPEIVNTNKPLGSPLSPTAFGLDAVSDIFDLDLEEWQEYQSVPENTFAGLGCAVEYNGLVYSFRSEIRALDPQSWAVIDNFPPIPENLQNPGKCSPMEVNGEPGILLRYGYWFGFNTQEWQKLAIPPNDPVTNDVNVMWSFRDRPTVFGQSNCDEEANCEFKDVIQYNPDNDRWELLGRLKSNRRVHEVIEVPGEICDHFNLDNDLPYIKYDEIVATTDSLQMVTATSEGVRDEVAMIIGGFDSSKDEPVLRTVELFGCSGTETISLEEYPVEGGYLMGATYMEEDGLVLSCGGYVCLGASTNCQAREDCHYWDPTTGGWEDAAPLIIEKFNFLMAYIPNIEVSLTDMTAAAIGEGNRTEILNEAGDEWIPYLDLPERDWFALGCLIQKGDFIYSIGDTVEVLNVLDWTIQSLGDVPDGLRSQGRCGYVEIDGNPGIFLRYGYFFDLITETWSKVTLPPYDPVNPTSLTNALWSYEGKPTVFGEASCDQEGNCEMRNIVQYDASKDTWKIIGTMQETRDYHEVVMLPSDICSNFVDVPGTEATEAEDTVALIVGGTLVLNSAQETYKSAEVFGCPNYGSTSVRIRDIPNPTYLHSGLYRDDVNKVMICGGTSCTGQVCLPTSDCFYWPSDDESLSWYAAPSLLDTHSSNLMVMAPNLNKESNPMEPLILGNGLATEILDVETEEWGEYNDTEYRNWYSTRCLVEKDGIVFNLRSLVQQLDLSTWQFADRAEIPEGLQRPGKCSVTTIDGEEGIFLSEGYFYNLSDGSWTKKAVPPIDPLVDFPNSMWTFRGRPTFFGENICDEDALCDKTGVLQYMSETDSWERIGTMLVSRRNHEVIEIPASFCDQIIVDDNEETTTTPIPPTLPTSSSTTTTTTTSTTTDVDVNPSSSTTTEEGGGGDTTTTDGAQSIIPSALLVVTVALSTLLMMMTVVV